MNIRRVLVFTREALKTDITMSKARERERLRFGGSVHALTRFNAFGCSQDFIVEPSLEVIALEISAWNSLGVSHIL